MRKDTITIFNLLNEDYTLPPESNKKDFEGFILGIEHNNEYKDLFDLDKGYISEMSPQDYLDYVSQDIFKTSPILIDKYISKDKETFERCHKIAEDMRNGNKYDIPFLDFKNRNQDGNHRAAAAYINGYKTIPVLILY